MYMKDHVEISHLTKFHALRINSDQVIYLETWFKIHTNFSNVEIASPKTILTLEVFMILVSLFILMGKYT